MIKLKNGTANGSFTATNTTIENFATDVQLTGAAKASMIVIIDFVFIVFPYVLLALE